MLERADRQQLGVLARDLAEVALDKGDLVCEPAPSELGAQLSYLLGGRVDAGTERRVVLPGVKQQAAPATADIDEGLARLQLYFAADVIHLVLLRLLERGRSLGPIGAGVHHADRVEPIPVERLSQAIVVTRIRLRLLDRAVRESPFVPAIAKPHQRVRQPVVPTVESGAKSKRDVAVDVDAAREVGLQQADIAERDRAALCAP